MRRGLGLLLLSCLVAGQARGAEPSLASFPSVVVDRIEVTGVVSFVQSEIEDLLEIAPGDRLERARVLRTSENLEEFFRSHGYEQASVRTRLSRQKGDNGATEAVLDFVITEGRPTRVAAIRFSPDSIRNDAFRKYWGSLELNLGSRVGLAPGDLFDQERIAAGKRAIQDLLASEEFVGAKIDDIRVVDSEPPLLAGMDKARSTGRWVALDFHVDLGDRVVFGFRGNTVFTLGRLSSLVEEQRILGFGKDYLGAIRGRIEDEYRSEGYAQVRVIPYSVENPVRQEKRVTYHITEGPRVRLEEVAFDGNSVFSNEELRSRFFQQASVLTQHGYYFEKDVQKALNLVVEWMKASGYLAAKVVTTTTVPGTPSKRVGQKGSSVRLIVYLYEGDRTIVQSVGFQGLTAFGSDWIKAKLGLREGQPLNLFAFSEGLEAIKTAYRAKGYLEVRIANEGTDQVVRYSDDNRSADIVLQFVEGPQFKVSAIAIEGLVATKEVVVRRELQFREGEVLSETALADTTVRLRRLEIFSVVTIHLHDDAARPGSKRVVISVQEGTPGLIAGGPGLRNDLGVRLFGQVAYTNLWGLNHTLSLAANANRRFDFFHFVEYQAQLAYVYPWFASNDLIFRPAFTASGTQYIQFDATVYDVSAAWEKKLLRDPQLTAIFSYSLQQVHQFNARSEADNQQLRIGAIIPGLRLDTRDNPLSPTTGWFAMATWELASPWLLSGTDKYPIGYSRIQARVDRIISLGGGISWYLSYRAGYEISTETPVLDPGSTDPRDPNYPGSGAIPLIKQFALGGASSLRGFKEQELNAYDQIIRGSLSYSNYRTQVDFPVAGQLRIGPFVDAANLLVDNHSVGEFFFSGLQVGAGFGFHYLTPVGPVNLDVGFKLTSPGPTTRPLQGESNTNFYFSIGLI